MLPRFAVPQSMRSYEVSSELNLLLMTDYYGTFSTSSSNFLGQVVFPAHFNPYNSFLLILQISLLFTCALASNKKHWSTCLARISSLRSWFLWFQFCFMHQSIETPTPWVPGKGRGFDSDPGQKASISLLPQAGVQIKRPYPWGKKDENIKTFKEKTCI